MRSLYYIKQAPKCQGDSMGDSETTEKHFFSLKGTEVFSLIINAALSCIENQVKLSNCPLSRRQFWPQSFYLCFVHKIEAAYKQNLLFNEPTKLYKRSYTTKHHNQCFPSFTDMSSNQSNKYLLTRITQLNYLLTRLKEDRQAKIDRFKR